MRLGRMSCFKSRTCNFATSGLVTMAVGLIMAFYGFPKFIKYEIAQRVALENGTEGYEMFKDPPIPLTFKVYLFNVTNPKEVAEGANPIVNEVGPYIYDQHRIKGDIKVVSEDTISFYTKKIFTFNEKASFPLTQEDQVTVLNVALVGMAVKVNEMMPSVLSMLQKVIPSLFNEPTDPFLRTTVGELLFDGVLLNCTNRESHTVDMVCSLMKSKLPPTIRESEIEDEGYYFSMFRHFNDTFDGPYIVQRGIVEPNMLGNIVSYKNKTTLDIWENGCEVLKGTDTTIFPPVDEVNYPRRIYIFQPDVCRVMYAEYVAKRTRFDLQALRYEATQKVLAANSSNPENGCFCKENWSAYRDGCSLNGVQNLEPCQDSAVIASFPHFYLADPSFLEYVEGLEPDKDKHETFVEIEPKTGTPLDGAKRMQFNMELQKLDQIEVLANVAPGLFPIMWVEESAEVNADIKRLLMSVHNKIKFGKVAQWILVVVGIILLMVAYHHRRRGLAEKWSWSPSRVAGVDLVVETSERRPAAAAKGGRAPEGRTNVAFEIAEPNEINKTTTKSV